VPQRSATIRFRTGFADYREAEAGLGRALGGRTEEPGIGARLAASLAGLIPNGATVDESGIRIQGVHRPWEEIGLAYETDNLICLVVTRNTGPITLPKRAMTHSNLQTIRALVAEHVETTPEKLEWIARVRTGEVR
jgi:hypothetical protein